MRLSKIRQLTGDHMIMSKAVTPHAFSVVEVDYANVDRTRSAVKREWKASEGFSLTYLPFICRALVDALAEFPHLNASVGQKELIVHRYIDLGIAVDLDYQGLLVPVVRDADTKRLRAIAREISDLAARAKARKLSPDEIQGGTFTVSNNGSAGSVLTAPIINQPQVAILSTDAIVRRPVAVDLPDGSEGIAVHPVGNLAMSWDHRAFDGAYAANFLLADQDDPGDPRLGRGALTAAVGRTAARPLAGPGRLRRGPRPAARPVRARPRAAPAAARAPARLHARRPGLDGQRARRPGRRRRRRWCGPTAAVTSPTTARASSSATRS